jgi:uncharacterized protein YndB with AHSA1/START domain
VFREITPPERIVFTFAWDEEGERGMETLVTITFANDGGKTRMTFHQTPFQSVGERDGHRGPDRWRWRFARMRTPSRMSGRRRWRRSTKPSA